MTLSETDFQDQLNYSLRKLADDLKPHEDYNRRGILMCEKVRKCLEQKQYQRSFSITSTYYGCTVSRLTDAEKPDFDIVMTINKPSSTFPKVMNYWAGILRAVAYHLEIVPASVRTNQSTIQFLYFTGMRGELRPATDDKTVSQLYEMIEKKDRERRYYSSHVVQTQLEFMKEQDPFAHAVARLAKFWYMSFDLQGAIVPHGITIFELLAVAAVDKEKPGVNSMVQAFRRLYHAIGNWGQLTLSFDRYYGSWGDWQVFHTDRLKKPAPYLMEPGNPDNNLLEGLNAETIEMFKKNAKVMRERFGMMVERREFCRCVGESCVEIDVVNLLKLV